MSARPPVVFIARDFILDAALDAAAAELARAGVEVIRGPGAVAGTKTMFARSAYAEYFSRAEVMVVSTRTLIGAEVLDAAPALRGIVFPSIGTETLDLRLAEARTLIVANGATPENFHSVAEATVMLILALMYDLHGSERVLRLSLPRPAQLRARMLQGKTLGIVGLGRIGRGVIQRLAGWGVRILAYDPHAGADAAGATRAATLDELLAESDIVSLHAAPAAGAAPLIGRRELRQMRRTAYLINTARGALVDEAAVCAALHDGSIAGAALDAFEVEPLPVASALRSMDHAILTPHMVAHTGELYASFAPACVENVQRILSGRPPVYVRNPEVLARWLCKYG